MLDWLEKLGFSEIISQCILFYVELVIGVLLFSAFFKKRRFFVLRLAGCLAFISGASAIIFWRAYYLYDTMDIYGSKVMLLLGSIAVAYLFSTLLVCIGMVRFCFFARGWEATFCGVCGYSVQHIVYRVNLAAQYYLFYGNEASWASALFLVFSAAAVYASSYFLFARRLKGREHIAVENKKLVSLLGIVLIVMMIFGGLGLTYMGSADMKGTSMLFVECGFAVIVCYLTLFTLLDSVKSKDMEANNRRLQWLWRADRKQFEVSKRNVEQLNVKYHDLKYMLRTMRADKESEQEIEQCLRLYEALYRTGNETLDVVLTEKSMLGARYGIGIACVADGGCLNPMDPVHLYSLFGNALDNAIECLKNTDGDKKVIDVTVRRKGAMAMVQVENYTPAVPEFRNGLPVTTKSDAENHGFGMISMRNIVERYGGSMRVSVSDGVFSLLILFPESFGQKKR